MDMRMDWSFLSFGKARARGIHTAVVVRSDGVALAQVDTTASRPHLQHCQFHAANESQLAEALSTLGRQQNLAKAECHTVMPLGSYSLLLIEAPDVPANELRAAVRWRIRELIDFHVDDAILDVFDAPASGARTTQTHLYVVVSRSNDVKQLADQLQDAGIGLGVIDIPELALRNVAAQLPEDAQGVALLYFGAERGLIALCRNQTLYLARTLDIGQTRLQEAAADGQTEALFDALALEVQRSLDYYDRTFQQAAISHLLITPLVEPVPGLVEGLRDNLGLQARMLELSEVVDGAEKVSAESAAHCLLAIGAALRSESKTL
jgi:MSHA biogenesis protein MshI